MTGNVIKIALRALARLIGHHRLGPGGRRPPGPPGRGGRDLLRVDTRHIGLAEVHVAGDDRRRVGVPALRANLVETLLHQLDDVGAFPVDG